LQEKDNQAGKGRQSEQQQDRSDARFQVDAIAAVNRPGIQQDQGTGTGKKCPEPTFVVEIMEPSQLERRLGRGRGRPVIATGLRRNLC